MTRNTRLVTLLIATMVAATGSLRAPAASAARAAQAAADPPVTDWSFYRVKWGAQQEFLDLFQKNNYPISRALLNKDILSIKAYEQNYHGDGRADWTFAVALTYRNTAARAAATGPAPPSADVMRTLFPDQATFQKEERRRLELLDAHWDVQLREVDFETRRSR